MTALTVQQMRYLVDEFLSTDRYLARITKDVEDIQRRQDKLRMEIVRCINEEEAKSA